MKRLLLCAALITSLQGNTFAQNDEPVKLTKTDLLFNNNYLNDALINNRHIVYFPKGEQMIIELGNVMDYNMLRNLDSLLTILRNDIAFYNDSIGATDNVRIDYRLNTSDNYKEIRFKKYAQDGDIYIKRNNKVDRLKIEKDTVRLILLRPLNEQEQHTRFYSNVTQVSFYLNNYTNIDNFIKNKDMLHHIIDTLAAVSQPKDGHYVINPNKYKSTITYSPYSTDHYTRFQKTDVVLDNEGPLGIQPEPELHKRRYLTMGASLGAGLVRNTIAPTGDISVQYNNKWDKNDVSYIGLTASPYFLFDRDVHGNFLVNDNWFLNAEIGSHYNSRSYGWMGNKVSFGVGYLIAAKGGYFNNTTLKVFTNFYLTKDLSISPELISTDNFKQIFPGLTLKIL